MSFDALAPHYRWMEWVLAGKKLQTCRTFFLEDLQTVQSVLIAGEGNGRFLLECRRRWPRARIHCVDASAGMLEQARRRLLHCGPMQGVEFTHADLLSWTPPQAGYDLIVTHFFLDCFTPEQLAGVVARLARAAQPKADWLLADFSVPPTGLGRLRAQMIHRLMYSFFRLATALPARRWTCPDPLLRTQGFKLVKRNVREWGLLNSDHWRREA